MRFISFINPKCENPKVVIPEVFQSSLNFMADGSEDGTGQADTSLFGPVASGSSAAYGGTVVNKGCCGLELFVTFLGSNECDSCSLEDNPPTEQKIIKVAPNSKVTLPAAYIVHISARAIDSDSVPKDVASQQVVEFESCATTPVEVPEYSAITFWKSAELLGFEVGDTVVYTFEVQNNGNINVGGVTIDDPTLGVVGLPVVPDPILPGQTGVATVNYTITAADVAATQIVNSATVNATDENGIPLTEPSCDPDVQLP